jgi:nucleotide-binding universal stress UspA family protein
MTMYKTILVAVDLGHAPSWKIALPTAIELARLHKAQLHVLAVVPDFGSPLVGGFFPEDFMAKAVDKAKEQLDALVATEVPADIGATAHIADGVVHTEILTAIGTVGADLVVMASHAPDAIREFLIGSNADRVVRRSPVSVLVARG